MAVATRDSQERLADALIGLGPDTADSFFALVRRRLDDEKGRLSTVTIDYDRLKVTTQAKLSRDALSSLKNVVLDALKALTGNRAGTEELTILHSLSGQIQPGRFTLLLGPPSSGKSTLLRALAGRLPKQGVSGSIKWNGHDPSEFCAARTVAFVSQVDAHIAMLSARETATFSHNMQTPPRSVKKSAYTSFVGEQTHELNSIDAPSKPGKSPTLGAEHVAALEEAISNNSLTGAQLDALVDLMLDGSGRVDLIMHMFGLANCADTPVGNEMMRGISGGERKRLSTVEMLMGQQRVCIYDEISTGLDSATLFNVIRWLRAINHHLDTTTVISLLQPPPETFVLFDDVMIMAEGRIVFHGAVQDAVPFFHGLGFRLPPRKDVPSYLQEIMTVRGQVAYASPELKRACRVPPDLDESDEEALAEMDLLVSLDDMVAALQTAREGSTYVHSLQHRHPKIDDGLVPSSDTYAPMPLAAFRHVLARQSKLLIRDQSLVKARIGQCLLMGLVIGLFFNGLNVNQRDARTFLGAMFMAVMFMEFGCMPQTTAVVRNRNVWFKQRACNMYSASSYAWSMSIVQLPLSIFEALLFAVILYFLIGFSLDGAKYFLIFCLTLMLASLSTASLFRLVGCLFRSAPIANAIAGFVMLMLIVNSGYIIAHRDIPPWVIYFYWLSPYAYALRSLAINEFTSPRWEVSSPDPDTPLGKYVLQQFDYYSGRAWIWVGLGYLVFFYILCTQLAAVSLALMDPPHQQAVIQKKGDTQADYKAARNAKLAAEESVETQSPDQRIRTPSPHAMEAAMEAGAVRTPGSLEAQNGSHAGSSARGHHEVARTLPFTPISVIWRNLSYYVPAAKGATGPAALNIMPQDDPNQEIAGKKRLLDNLTGHARPGVLTALMGGSGAGKTTLMDVLAGRKTQGVITGDLLVNGHPKEQDTWSRVVGYVEQTDVHSAGLTVEESLRFSAALRLTPDIKKAQREGFVLDVLEVVELLPIRSNAVGVPGESGLSVEQRRRLSIGVELVANPSVVFMDEPTSGLDARSAVAVMTAVKNVAANGRTVMVTIHQPSQEIFEAFDALVLLAKGGTSIFFGLLGVQSSLLVSYFESIPGVPRLPENYNPATWMLEVSGGGAKMHVDSVDADFHQLYVESDLARRTEVAVNEMIESDRAAHAPITMSSRYAATNAQQLRHLLWKHSLLYWRNPGYNLGRIAGALITGLVFGLTFWREGKLPTDEPITIANVQNILGSVYSGLAFMGITNLICGIPAFSAERQVAYRERASSMYAVFPFALSTGLVEIPYILVQTILFFPIAYFMIGFKNEVGPIFLYAIIFTESITLYTFMGQLFTYLMPNAVLAQVLGVLNHMIWQIFNGFLVPRPLMPSGWVWLNYISATTYVVYALGASQLGDIEDKIVAVGYDGCSRDTLEACPTVEQFMREYFGFKYELRWWCTLILLAFIMFFRISAMIVLKVINHQIR